MKRHLSHNEGNIAIKRNATQSYLIYAVFICSNLRYQSVEENEFDGYVKITYCYKIYKCHFR